MRRGKAKHRVKFLTGKEPAIRYTNISPQILRLKCQQCGKPNAKPPFRFCYPCYVQLFKTKTEKLE